MPAGPVRAVSSQALGPTPSAGQISAVSSQPCPPCVQHSRGGVSHQCLASSQAVRESRSRASEVTGRTVVSGRSVQDCRTTQRCVQSSTGTGLARVARAAAMNENCPLVCNDASVRTKADKSLCKCPTPLPSLGPLLPPPPPLSLSLCLSVSLSLSVCV